MPVRKRNMKRRAKLGPDEAAWLRGDRDCGWVEFYDWDRLEALWEAHGDKKRFEWRRGMDWPVLIEAVP